MFFRNAKKPLESHELGSTSAVKQWADDFGVRALRYALLCSRSVTRYLHSIKKNHRLVRELMLDLRLLFFLLRAYSSDSSSKRPESPCTITVCVHFALEILAEEATLQMELSSSSFANEIFDNCWNLILLKFPEKCNELNKSRFILRLPHGRGRIYTSIRGSCKAGDDTLVVTLFGQGEMSFCTTGIGLFSTNMFTDSGGI